MKYKPSFLCYFNLFIEILIGNLIPILWLYFLQPIVNITKDIAFNGVWFWALYALYALWNCFTLWGGCSAQPDPSYKTLDEIDTPIFGFAAIIFQILIYFGTMLVYFIWYR